VGCSKGLKYLNKLDPNEYSGDVMTEKKEEKKYPCPYGITADGRCDDPFQNKYIELVIQEKNTIAIDTDLCKVCIEARRLLVEMAILQTLLDKMKDTQNKETTHTKK